MKPVAAALPVLLGLLPACSGSGHVLVTALDFQNIDPPAGPPPTFSRIDFDRCLWWTDESGRVWIAMEREQPLLLGSEWRFRFRLSLVLAELPAGRARNYVVSKRELRATARAGPAQSRFSSLGGIVALYREPTAAGAARHHGDQLRGSFRLEVAREVQQALGGWGRPARYLMMGTFTAVRDEVRGPQIAAETETPGREREPPPVRRGGPTSGPTRHGGPPASQSHGATLSWE